MSFANPLALWLLAAAPLVLLFHLYRVDRDTVRVTTLRFWTPLDPAAGAPRPAWHRFKPSWPLLLQLLAVLALALALARPTFHAGASGWPREVLIIDVSASMKASDVPAGRFAAARAQALEDIARLAPGQEAMLMTSQPELVVPYSGDRERLRSALGRLRPSDSEGDLEEALRIADALSRDGPPARIRLYTDAAFAPPANWASATPPALEWRVVGERQDNVGITAFELRRSPSRVNEYEVFLVLSNFSAEAKSVRFQLNLDHSEIYQQELALAAGVQRALALPFTHERAGALTAQIVGADDLSADNSAHAVLPAPRLRQVMLAGEDNLFLQEALRADPTNEVRTTRTWPLTPAATAADVTVLDGVAPGTLPPGRYLLIRTVPDNAPLEVTGQVSVPPIVDWDPHHRVTRYLDLEQVIVEQALAVRATGAGTVLAQSPETPLIHAWDENGVRAVFIGFDLHHSDLRVRAAFPLLVRNALDWLDPVHLDDLVLHRRAGEVAATPRAAGGQSNAVARTGATQAQPVLQAETAGLQVTRTAAGEEQHYAINLLSEQESALAPGRALGDTEGDTGGNTTAPAAPGYERPYTLWWGLALIALLALLGETALYLRRRRRELPALVARTVVLALIAAALWNPALPGASDAVHVVFALDRSQSIPAPAKAHAAEQVAAAMTRADDSDSAQLVLFAEQARASASSELSNAARAAAAASEHGDDTDIAQALRQGLSQLPTHGNRRIVLLSDGNENRGASLAAAREAQRLGVTLHAVPIGGPPPGEVWLAGLALPGEVRLGEPFGVRLTAWSEGASEARLELDRNGEQIASQRVSLKPGKNVLPFRQAVDQQGYAIYEARLHGSSDHNGKNNWAVGAVAVRSRPRLLLLDADPSQTRHLRDALAIQQIDLTVRGPAQIAQALAYLSEYDGLVLSNISSLDLSGADMQRIHDYVRDEGGGLLMLGGEQSFGLGGYYQTPIEQALPVTMAVRQKLDVPSTALVLVIDRSGSMNRSDGQFNRLDLAKEAAQRAVELLSERSEIGVLAFDMKSHWIVPIGPNRDKGTVLRSIASLQAGGGGTQLLWGLEKAYRAIDKRETVIRHVIILSDGEVYSSKFPELLGNMVGKNITVSAVTIGSKTGRPQLRQISELGKGRFYYSSDASKLPRIFTMETQLAAKTALIEEPFTPVVRNSFHEIFQGVDLAGLPGLDGYVATTAKRSAETLLVSHHQDPVLAVWRYGLGRAAAFTSEIKSRWGARWLEWPELSRLSAQLARWTLRSRQRNDLEVAARVHHDQGEIRIDAVGEDGELVNFLQGEVGVVLPDQQRRILTLRQFAPGRYRATFPATLPGAYLLGVSLHDDERPLATLSSRAVQSYPREHRELAVNANLLEALVRPTGGRILSDPANVFALPREKRPHTVDAWPWLLGAALVALILDLAYRYWRDRRRAPPI